MRLVPGVGAMVNCLCLFMFVCTEYMISFNLSSFKNGIALPRNGI